MEQNNINIYLYTLKLTFFFKSIYYIYCITDQ